MRSRHWLLLDTKRGFIENSTSKFLCLGRHHRGEPTHGGWCCRMIMDTRSGSSKDFLPKCTWQRASGCSRPQHRTCHLHSDTQQMFMRMPRVGVHKRVCIIAPPHHPLTQCCHDCPCRRASSTQRQRPTRPSVCAAAGMMRPPQTQDPPHVPCGPSGPCTRRSSQIQDWAQSIKEAWEPLHAAQLPNSNLSPEHDGRHVLCSHMSLAAPTAPAYKGCLK